jgi:hypothetical protein
MPREEHLFPTNDTYHKNSTFPYICQILLSLHYQRPHLPRVWQLSATRPEPSVFRMLYFRLMFCSQALQYRSYFGCGLVTLFFLVQPRASLVDRLLSSSTCFLAAIAASAASRSRRSLSISAWAIGVTCTGKASRLIALIAAIDLNMGVYKIGNLRFLAKNLIFRASRSNRYYRPRSRDPGCRQGDRRPDQRADRAAALSLRT